MPSAARQIVGLQSERLRRVSNRLLHRGMRRRWIIGVRRHRDEAGPGARRDRLAVALDLLEQFGGDSRVEVTQLEREHDLSWNHVRAPRKDRQLADRADMSR